MDVEWEHNPSVERHDTSNFRDLSSECIEKVNKLYESGHTPSTARQQELRATCIDELTYHKEKADRSATPRKIDFNHRYSKFGEENWGKFGCKGPLMFEKLEEKLRL